MRDTVRPVKASTDALLAVDLAPLLPSVGASKTGVGASNTMTVATESVALNTALS